MPKREHIKSGGVLPPFSENLILWAPLTEGDLTDHIGGLAPTFASTPVWDNNRKMYLLDSTQNSAWKAGLQFTNPSGFNINCQDGWTMWAMIETVYTSWNYNALMACTSCYLRNNNWGTNKQCFSYTAEVYTGTLPSGVHKVCFASTNTDIEPSNSYVDGIEVGYAGGYSAAQMVNPPTQCDVCETNSGNRRIRLYARDIRLYNRRLTPQEIATL